MKNNKQKLLNSNIYKYLYFLKSFIFLKKIVRVMFYYITLFFFVFYISQNVSNLRIIQSHEYTKRIAPRFSTLIKHNFCLRYKGYFSLLKYLSFKFLIRYLKRIPEKIFAFSLRSSFTNVETKYLDTIFHFQTAL